MRAIEALLADVAHAARALLRSPAFAATSILVLAAGIGLAVAMLTVFDRVLRQPLPVAEQDRIVVLWGGAEGSPRQLPLTWEQFERYREEASTLETVGGALSSRAGPHTFRDGDRTVRLAVGAVTGNFFDLLGAQAVRGRLLEPADDRIGAAPVLVLSHAAWRRQFNGDPAIVGRRLILHERSTTYTVAGIAPLGLEFPLGTDVWVPAAPSKPGEVVPLGRLADRARAAHAAAELRSFLLREDRQATRGLTASATPLAEVIVGDVGPAVVALSACAALLLLMAAANVANLLLVRGVTRWRDLAVRRALGGSSSRLLRQLFLEHVLLAGVAAVLGAALAVALVNGLLALAPADLPRVGELRLAPLPVTGAAALVLAVVLIFGMVPARRLSRDDRLSLGPGSRAVTLSPSSRRVQQSLGALQVAAAVVLLATAGLLVRSLQQLQHLDIGFRTETVAVVQMTWPQEHRFADPDRVGAFLEVLIPRLEAVPGVIAASPVNVGPFTGAGVGWDGWFVTEERRTEPAGTLVFNMAVVGEAYFRALALPILRGRAFTDGDREGLPVVVVSEAAARMLWPGEDPIGKRVSLGQPETDADWRTVVGLVPEIRYRALRAEVPTVYIPWRQMGGAVAAIDTLAIRTDRNPSAVLPLVRHEIQETAPQVLVGEAVTMDGLLGRQLAQPRASALMMTIFGMGALLLTAVGLYAVLAFIVSQRTRELAIRHALGASPWRLRSMVLGQMSRMTMTGLVVGMMAVVAGGRLVESLLFGVSATDPLTLAAVTLTLTALALGASMAPAERAARTNTWAVLRED